MQASIPLPAGTAVNWVDATGDARCGGVFAPVTTPQADSVVNWRARGTVAGKPCTIEARLVWDGEPLSAATFTATWDAGPPAPIFDTGWSPILALPGVVAVNAVQDAHGNPIPFRIVPAGVIAVAGEQVGTAKARSVSYVGGPTNDGHRQPLSLVNAAGVEVGRLVVVVQGGGDTYFWRAAGVGGPAIS